MATAVAKPEVFTRKASGLVRVMSPYFDNVKFWLISLAVSASEIYEIVCGLSDAR